MDTALVFGIIFAAIVIMLLMFFGFRYINDWMGVSCDSQIGQQVTNLKGAVKATLTLSKDASQETRILIPGCIKKVCFVDPDHPEINNKEGGWVPNEFLMQTVSSYKYNVVLIRSDDGIEGYDIQKFRPYVNFCLTSSEDVILRNIGTLVEVTLPGF